MMRSAACGSRTLPEVMVGLPNSSRKARAIVERQPSGRRAMSIWYCRLGFSAAETFQMSTYSSQWAARARVSSSRFPPSSSSSALSLTEIGKRSPTWERTSRSTSTSSRARFRGLPPYSSVRWL